MEINLDGIKGFFDDLAAEWRKITKKQEYNSKKIIDNVKEGLNNFYSKIQDFMREGFKKFFKESNVQIGGSSGGNYGSSGSSGISPDYNKNRNE